MTFALLCLLLWPSEATLVSTGAGSAQALAVSPQGVPFVATADSEGRIWQVLGRSGLLELTGTGGDPRDMTFDGNGDLYVADRTRKAVLKVTPWGEVTVFAGPFASPEGVAVSASGDIYLADPGASRVYRLDQQGRSTVLASGVDGAGAITVTSDGRYLFVSNGKDRIWRLTADGKSRTEFLSLSDGGGLSGLVLDENGNLYVARKGTGKVSVVSPEGGVTSEYTIPGAEVTDIAFGGLEWRTLFVSEVSTGAVYKLQAPHRSQRLPWEPDRPLRIMEPPDGAILNRHDGETTDAGLRVTVRGVCRAGGPVQVNGASVLVRDGKFETVVLLRDRENRITAEGPGGLRETITLLWDRDSFPRYRVSTDDNIWFLRDIARNADRYRSIFENPYLGFWREMNRKYGAKVHFNIYYETEGFNLSQMPHKFRPEWQENKDWIRLTFHARANDPARPYIHSSAEKIREDYRLITREIERFAGKEMYSPITTVHWGEATRAAARALREEGVTGLVGYFEAREELPAVCYYLPLEQWRYLMGRDYWKDTKEDLLFVRHDIVINTLALEQIVPHLERVAADPHQAEIMEMMIHEQYFYPDYVAYQPDFRDRVERAIEWVTQRGYRPVFFEDGFLGSVRRSR